MCVVFYEYLGGRIDVQRGRGADGEGIKQGGLCWITGTRRVVWVRGNRGVGDKLGGDGSSGEKYGRVACIYGGEWPCQEG